MDKQENQGVAQITNIEDRIPVLLANMDYSTLLTQLSSLQHMQIEKAENIRKLGLKNFHEHLQTKYTNQTSTAKQELTTHLDMLLQLLINFFPQKPQALVPTTCADSPNGMLCWLLSQSIEFDIRYTYIIYKSKSQLFFQSQLHEPITQALKYFVYTTQMHRFVAWILGNNAKGKGFNQAMFQDFGELLKMTKNTYEKTRYSEAINLEGEKHEHQGFEILEQMYLGFVKLIVNECSQSNLDNQTMQRRVYTIIQNAVSISTLVSPTILPKISHIFHSLIQKCGSWMPSLFLFPPVLLLYGIQCCQISLLSPVCQSYIDYKLVCHLSPNNTLESRVGGLGDLLLGVIEQIVVRLCRFLDNADQLGIKVQNERIYLDGENFIDLVQIYRRMSIFSGFLSPQHSKICYEKIKQTLKLTNPRYSASLKQKIWCNLLAKSNSLQLSYRIYCISEYRKILSSIKSTANNEDQYALVVLRAASVLISEISNINKNQEEYNYIGHLLSFAINWNINAKLLKKMSNNWTQAKKGWVLGKVQESSKEIDGLLKNIQQKLNQKLQLEQVKDQQLQKQVNQGKLTIQDKNKRSKTVDIELLLFRLKDIILPA